MMPRGLETSASEERERDTTMTKSVNHDSTYVPLDAEVRELMDPETWDWESAEALLPCRK